MDLGLGRVVPFGVPLVVNGGWRDATSGNPHAGLDIGVPVGTPILAAADGTVTRSVPTDSSDAGIFAEVTHPNGFVSRYLHFSSIAVGQGQRVRKGQELGRSGSTGLSSGPHLHFELRAPGILQLTEIIRSAGQPVGGFSYNYPSVGTGFPAEPWLPVDSYLPSVVASALDNQIPLYPELHRYAWVLPVAMVGAAGVLLYLMRRGA